MLSASGLADAWGLCVWVTVAALFPALGARIEELRDRTAFVSMEMTRCALSQSRAIRPTMRTACGIGLCWCMPPLKKKRKTRGVHRRHKAVSRRLVEAMLPREVTDSLRAGVQWHSRAQLCSGHPVVLLRWGNVGASPQRRRPRRYVNE